MSKKIVSVNSSGEGKGDRFISDIAVDCLIFGFDSGCLKLLLCKDKEEEKWVVPASFISIDEDVDAAAMRILNHRTGLKDSYIKQFCFFGEKDRTNSTGEFGKMLVCPDRFVSLSYYALIKYKKAKVYCEDCEHIGWFNVHDLPEIYPTYRRIIDKALFTLRQQVGFLPLGYELLPEKFTMPELRTIYEAVLGREIDRRNFQRKMLSIGYIKALHETRKAGAHKSPNLYSFDKVKYKEAEEKGLQIMSNNL